MIAGPNQRAGFIAAPVRPPPTKISIVMVSPITSPAMALAPRWSTATPNTEYIRKKVMMISARTAVAVPTPSPTAGVPRFTAAAAAGAKMTLSASVVDATTHSDPPRDHQPDGERRVVHPTRNVTGGSDHESNREPVGQGDCDQVLAAGRNDGASADEDQRKRADKLDDTVLQPILFHNNLLSAWESHPAF